MRVRKAPIGKKDSLIDKDSKLRTKHLNSLIDKVFKLIMKHYIKVKIRVNINRETGANFAINCKIDSNWTCVFLIYKYVISYTSSFHDCYSHLSLLRKRLDIIIIYRFIKRPPILCSSVQYNIQFLHNYFLAAILLVSQQIPFCATKVLTMHASLKLPFLRPHLKCFKVPKIPLLSCPALLLS